MAPTQADLQAALQQIDSSVVVVVTDTSATAILGPTRYQVDFLDGDGNDRSADVVVMLSDLIRGA